MQQRRYRPGDVLDDYCPRERRITDHAIVAMIDDHIKQTRCVVCDAEHEYKDGKVPAQRRKKPQAALFSQVLEGITGKEPPSRVSAQASAERPDDEVESDAGEQAGDAPEEMAPMVTAPAPDVEEPMPLTASGGLSESGTVDETSEPPSGDAPRREEGPWRRQLIRAALPRPEGQQPPQTRPAPEFTVRQPTNARGQRHGRRRGGGGGGFSSGTNGNHGAARFGRGGQGQGQGQGQGGRRRRGRGGKKQG